MPSLISPLSLSPSLSVLKPLTHVHTPACTHIRTHIHTCTHALTYVHAQTCMYTHACTCTHMHAHTHMHTQCTYTHVHTHVHTVHTHTRAHAHACTYTHAHVHTHAHTHTCTHAHMHAHMRTVVPGCTRLLLPGPLHQLFPMPGPPLPWIVTCLSLVTQVSALMDPRGLSSSVPVPGTLAPSYCPPAAMTPSSACQRRLPSWTQMVAAAPDSKAP